MAFRNRAGAGIVAYCVVVWSPDRAGGDMPYEIAELVAILVMVFMLGTFVLLFPLSRRLGKVMEEWIQLRHDSSPDRERLERIEEGLRLLHGEVESLDQRMHLMGDRQDFIESLSEARRSDSLAPGPDARD
ncbi:MAG: hypothetical protein P8125_01540 [Gemmatimonadota bacterium]